MAKWLVKSEPSEWSWNQHVSASVTAWTGVRNHQAAANLRAMALGEQAFFYHSNEGKEIVGIVEVVRTAYPDPEDPTGKWVLVDLRAMRPLPRPVTLAALKAESGFADLALIRQSRLSVLPVSESHWAAILRLGGLAAD